MTIKVPAKSRKHIHIFQTKPSSQSTYDAFRPITTVADVIADRNTCYADGGYCSNCLFFKANDCARAMNAYIVNSPEWAALQYTNPELFI